MAWKSGVYRSYSHLSSFFWDSSLSEERKNEILEWVKSLSDEDAAKLEDLIRDVREDEEYNTASRYDEMGF